MERVWIGTSGWTTDFVYLRFHGLEGGASHDYTDKELEPWARQILKAVKQNKRVVAYFNNDKTARAIDNARTLQRMIGKYAVRTPAPARQIRQ